MSVEPILLNGIENVQDDSAQRLQLHQRVTVDVSLPQRHAIVVENLAVLAKTHVLVLQAEPCR